METNVGGRGKDAPFGRAVEHSKFLEAFEDEVFLALQRLHPSLLPIKLLFHRRMKKSDRVSRSLAEWCKTFYNFCAILVASAP